jgi:D-alanyl-D-alanine carboxypeptidase
MAKNKRKLLVLVLGVLIIIGAAWYMFFGKNEPVNAPSQNIQNTSQTTNPVPQETPAFDKNRYSTTDPSSIWVVTNKKRPLPSGFVPSDLINIDGKNLRAEAAQATRQLMDEAAKSGVRFKVISGYRSFQTQQSLYQSYVRNDGQAQADTYSARPGYSEHQTGLAADLGNTSGSCDLEICFTNTPGGQWLAEHAHEYGFIIRYLEGKTPVTGYQYEPWHIRYVGKELATELKNHQTMEEFFGLPAAPAY